MATTKDSLLLDAVERNAAKIITLGKKKFKIRPMTNAVSARVDRLVAQRSEELKPADNPKELLLNLSKNRSLIPKCLSLMILHSWFKVTFFHWFYWRWLHATYNISEMLDVYQKVNEMNSIQDFFYFSASLQENNQFIRRMSEVNTKTMRQELSSEAGTK